VPTAFRSGWLYGNYLPNVGHYDVAEGYIEAAVPIMTGLDLNGSIRYTNYSTSGGVNTWKVGANYQPLDDVKFRVTYSHDIRAPNLSELFAAGIARANTVLVNNASFAFNQNQTGNGALVPEAANSLGAGVVITPRWISGLTASVDYFNINVKHEIGTITAQNIADLCFQSNVRSYCAAIHGTYNGAPSAATLTSISTIDLKPFNFTAQKMQGIDFELTYQVPLDEITLFGAIPGDLTLHGLATNYIQNYTNDGINPPTDVAGVNTSAGVPSWSYRVEATYHTDPWTFDLIGHGVSAGAYANEYVTCTTGCPASTVANRTINYNSIDGQYLMDATVSYDFTTYGGDTEAFFAVKNVFNTSPSLVGIGPDGLNTPAYPQTNSTLYDTIGRSFRMGVRFKF
jgi:iron complex outermembrane receptor protein